MIRIGPTPERRRVYCSPAARTEPAGIGKPIPCVRQNQPVRVDRPADSLASEDALGVLGVLHALVQRLLGGLLGLSGAAEVVQRPRQIQVAFAIGAQRCGFLVGLDRLRVLVGEQ